MLNKFDINLYFVSLKGIKASTFNTANLKEELKADIRCYKSQHKSPEYQFINSILPSEIDIDSCCELAIGIGISPLELVILRISCTDISIASAFSGKDELQALRDTITEFGEKIIPHEYHDLLHKRLAGYSEAVQNMHSIPGVSHALLRRFSALVYNGDIATMDAIIEYIDRSLAETIRDLKALK